MSLKTRLSLFISLLVSVMLVLNVFINDYYIHRELNLQAEHLSAQVGQQISELVEDYWRNETGRAEKKAVALRLALQDAADHLGPEVTWNSLQEVKRHSGAEQIDLLVPAAEGFQVLVSTKTGRQGEAALGRGDLPEEWTADADHVEEPFQIREVQLEDPEYPPIVWGYYFDSEHPYIIALTLSSKGFSPERMISDIKVYRPEILEIGIWNLGQSSPLGKEPLRYGAGTYTSDSRGMQLLKQAAGEAQFERAVIGGQTVLRSWYPIPDNDGCVISVVMDESQLEEITHMHRRNDLWSSVLILVATLIGTWLIIHYLLLPIKTILSKVNEVAFGRFDRVIKISRKDEIGELAQEINYMSESLKSYTDKLRSAFNENALIKEELESIFNNTADSIVIIGLDGRVIKVNQSFLSTFGYSEKEILFRSMNDFVCPLKPVFGEKELEGMLSGETLLMGEYKWQHRSGEHLMVSVTLSPVRNTQGEIWSTVAVARDITSRSKMEELLRQSEKLTTVGQLAAGVAHEIRNPLTTLRGFLQLQQQSGRLNLQHNDIMMTELDRINLIVSEFLILAKPQAARHEVKDIRFTLGDVISLLDSEGHLKNAVFHTQFTSESCLVSCEENQLKQVFINVIKNAIEAMPQGGNVYFDIQKEGRHAIVVTITDEGIGIPEEIIPRIGDPFFTAKESGTGLGIMVSQRIIQSHKGLLEISSTVGVGTSVKVTLPVASEGAESGQDSRASA